MEKETIAVLNGEGMSHVVGANGNIQCQNGGQFDGEVCVFVLLVFMVNIVSHL